MKSRRDNNKIIQIKNVINYYNFGQNKPSKIH